MQTSFSQSTNIIRDFQRDITYIPTPNTVRVIDQIVKDFRKGIRSFNIIGSYGTGKSSFLWAFEQSLLTSNKIFNADFLYSPKVEVLKFIGDYRSIKETFADYFNVKRTSHQTENILSAIFNRYYALGKKTPLLVIVIDEFGKFLEYASQNAPEDELYFIQQLAEMINNPKHSILLITTVHQNFDAYAYRLNAAQKHEWSKVKGRLREIAFNEPVEQLLYLASEHLGSNQWGNESSIVNKALAIAKKTKAFNIDPDYANDIANKLFPLDIMSANVLAIALQKYGQNERSLFSFLESTDHTGIHSFEKAINPFYNIACVYDYLTYNFYSFINSRYNPDFAVWAGIKNSLEYTERIFDSDIQSYFKIIKTIGLLNLTAASGADLGENFLPAYSENCLGIKNATEIIRNLVARKVIVYRSYNKRFALFEGTDLDIFSALNEAGDKVGDIEDVVTLLNREYQLPTIAAKSYSYVNGTPRLFEFKISDQPLDVIPMGEIDGFINLIFNENISISEVRNHSKDQGEAILFGYFKNSKSIKQELFDIEKTRKVIKENSDDKVAVKELENILQNHRNLLNHYILNGLYKPESDVRWFFSGREVPIASKKDFIKFLSRICTEVYHSTPIFKNELVNKHRISSSIHTAKKNYFRALVENWEKPDLGFEPNKFPPEKTIYLTLLKENGLVLNTGRNEQAPTINDNSTFSHLWTYSCEFLKSARHDRKSIEDFIEPLTRRPFKLKQGLIEFWTASFLFIKRDDYALFSENGYIPNITEEVLDLLIKNPEDYELKAFEVEGVKMDIFNSYRQFLNQELTDHLDNQTFISTIRPFLTFYKGLPEYSKNTRRLKKETLAVRNAIANSKDPEQSFFEDFPTALGFNFIDFKGLNGDLRVYIDSLQEVIRELRTCYDALIGRFEEFILSDIVGRQLSFEDYKEQLQLRYRKLKKHLLLSHQKTFIQRLDSKLDDRNAWLSSLAQCIIGKPLELLKDEDEPVLFEKFRTYILDLDSLTNISRNDIDESREDFLGIELSSFADGVNKKLLRLPKAKRAAVNDLENNIRSMLSNDKTVDMMALANLLKEITSK